MKQYEVSLIVTLASHLGSIRTLIRQSVPGHPSILDESDELLPLLGIGERECSAVGLSLSAMAFKRLAEAMTARAEAERLTFLIKEVQSRLSDELKAPLFFHVPEAHARYYKNPYDRWSEVVDKFPGAVVDIEEASKCLAFGRNTAAVFFAMRIIERGLKALAKAMGIRYAPSWDSYLRQIAKQFAAEWKDKSVELREKEPFYREAAALLTAVKVAWRNPTIHVRRDYDAVQAEEVVVATRGFMRQLATKLHE